MCTTTPWPTGGASAWTPANIDGGDDMYKVSCPSGVVDFCVATDIDGNAVQTSDPTGGAGAWSAPANIDSANFISDITCPDVTLCVAGDVAGNVIVATQSAPPPVTLTVNRTGNGAVTSRPAGINYSGSRRSGLRAARRAAPRSRPGRQ